MIFCLQGGAPTPSLDYYGYGGDQGNYDYTGYYSEQPQSPNALDSGVEPAVDPYYVQDDSPGDESHYRASEESPAVNAVGGEGGLDYPDIITDANAGYYASDDSDNYEG